MPLTYVRGICHIKFISKARMTALRRCKYTQFLPHYIPAVPSDSRQPECRKA